MTLKKRIFIIYFLGSLVPFVFIVMISYYTINSILTNKLESSIQSNLSQVTLSLENSLSGLNHISQQFAYEGRTVKELDELIRTEESFNRMKLQHQFKSKLNLITSTNPDIGLAMYYFEKDQSYRFANFPVKYSFSSGKLPLFAQSYGIIYYGPHESFNRLDNEPVLSVLRKVDFPGRDDAYVYIESGFQLVKNMLDSKEARNNPSRVVLLDRKGKILYSEAPRLFKSGTAFPGFSPEKSADYSKGYYWYKQESKQGWSAVSLFAEADFNKEKNRWFLQTSLFSLVLLGVSVLLAGLLWKMVYKPLGVFQKEIKTITHAEASASPKWTDIPEFDALLRQFQNMKRHIWELFHEIGEKEKQRVDLEVEKLLHQINPHFLMNTLDTAHWLAVMNGQHEIDRLVQSLNKLLYYNLGKLGRPSTIEEEIQATEQYLTLQQIRYDFQFDVRIQVEEELLKKEVPRFILQPLVENSLYHGLDDEGYIQVVVRQNRGIEIAIHDNGSGMSEEKIQELLGSEPSEQQKTGMGIGMSYVKRTIETRYGDRAKLEVRSELGKGTSIFLTVPIEEERRQL
ncbi:histidine kinase [Paenibacillus sp. FSL W8-1187]|uniref:histidine kinase n=1 Tax=Paenibacillus pasadenensis TaxID=217090 RepID=A0A2N5NCL6_9BACL|nr:histidine kinase [Paenibacillus pasadenensis]PLT48085.1 two-component sensor histidine kinase [Paenibacillus pasadenensis]